MTNKSKSKINETETIDVTNTKTIGFVGEKSVLEDKINPDHYKGNIETFDYLKDKLSPEELVGFCKGNIIKYVTRESKKCGVEDLKKAKWYLDKLIYLK